MGLAQTLELGAVEVEIGCGLHNGFVSGNGQSLDVYDLCAGVSDGYIPRVVGVGAVLVYRANNALEALRILDIEQQIEIRGGVIELKGNAHIEVCGNLFG